MSVKRRAKIAADKPAREAHLLAFPYCEAKAAGAPGDCFGGLHIHEPLTRARGGDPGDPENMKTCCDWHNDAIGQVPEVKAWAEGESGFLLREEPRT